MNQRIFVKICREIEKNSAVTQRSLSEACGASLGLINTTIGNAREKKLLSSDEDKLKITSKGYEFLEQFKVKNAIILSAGFGSRCVPLTYETPKGLLKVNGKPMIEHQIEQLLEKGITEIVIVVGYLKEKFDYLIDKYGVKLIFNPEFSTKNNLTSLYCALPYLSSSYVLMSDNWIESNIFNTYEPDSWFSCLYFEGETSEWCVKHSKTDLIKEISIGGADSFAVVGPAYFSKNFSEKFAELVKKYYNTAGTEDYYWEHVLREHISDLPIYMNRQTGNVYEFENLKELRAYDKSYLNETNNKIMEIISKVHNVPQGEIHGLEPIKEGLTNNSFKFSVGNENFVFRVPGTGTDKLINRRNEKKVYDLITPHNISDEIVYFDADTGIKITKFYDNVTIADPFDDDHLKECMKKIKEFHGFAYYLDHSFDIEKMIGYYYSLANEAGAIRFSDIDETLKKLQKLFDFKKKLNIKEILCHGDYAHINVLMFPNGKSRLIDFEYAGTSDPIMDVSMFAIFAEFDKERIELCLKMYCGGEPTPEETSRLYLYVALGGFLWCMWGQYKQAFGQEMGEYPLIMYRYLKDYYTLLEKAGFID